MSDALLATQPTIRFGRERRTHGYKLAIDGQAVVLMTRCGIDTRDGAGEYVVTHGVVSCEACEAVNG